MTWIGERLTATLMSSGQQRGLGAGGPQHPFAERHDQADLLGHRDELDRRDHAALGVAPAQQGLAAGHPVVAQADERLIVAARTRSCASACRSASFELAARLHAGIHGRLEEAIGAASVSLGAVERHVGSSSGARPGSVPSPGATAMPMLVSTVTA